MKETYSELWIDPPVCPCVGLVEGKVSCSDDRGAAGGSLGRDSPARCTALPSSPRLI